ncbi:hypothetical protein V8F06_014747 [Rhypophila decipiens]
MNNHKSDRDNLACLQDLQTTNPWLDKKRIENTKGGLFKSRNRPLVLLFLPGYRRIGSTTPPPSCAALST